MITDHREILSFIKGYTSQTGGRSPTYDELKWFTDAPTKNMVSRIMVDLERKGLISRIAGRARSVYITEAGFALLRGCKVEASNG